MFTTHMNLFQSIVNRDLYAVPADTVERALENMETFDLNALPVVDNGKYHGLVTREQLLESEELEIRIGSLKSSLKIAYLDQEQHIFDALFFFRINEVNILPVVNTSLDYQGFIDLPGLVNALEQVMDTQQPGGMIVLQTDVTSYSLAQITHVLESNDIRVLSSFSRIMPDSNGVELTLKVNTEDLSKVSHLLSRYDYRVSHLYTIQNPEEKADITARYEHLMNFINM